MRSIFSDPDAHGVRHIEAETTGGGTDRSVCLTLTLSGRTVILHEERSGELEIFGPPEMTEKFRQVAEAVNRIFGNQQQVEEAEPDHIAEG